MAPYLESEDEISEVNDNMIATARALESEASEKASRSSTPSLIQDDFEDKVMDKEPTIVGQEVTQSAEANSDDSGPPEPPETFAIVNTDDEDDDQVIQVTLRLPSKQEEVKEDDEELSEEVTDDGEASEDSWSPSPIPEDDPPGNKEPDNHPTLDKNDKVTEEFMKDLLM